MTTPANFLKVPYLRDQRKFPSDNINELASQVDQAYIDIAAKVNQRTIGLYPTNFPVVTGNRYYLNGSSKPQQTLRQMYPFTNLNPIPHNLNFSSITLLTPYCYGSYLDTLGNYNGAIFLDPNGLAGHVTFYVDATNINLLGAGAPTISTGIIVLEWISNF